MKTPSINFMMGRKIAGLISIGAVIGSVTLLALIGLSFGLDFTGGSLVELEFATEPALETVRETLVTA
ncbi:MAG: protein translocase subunit SecF, partial [Pseudomonadota bacterium]|nr:protein translocase subunit SecF [Pseudomonadota bacterium]